MLLWSSWYSAQPRFIFSLICCLFWVISPPSVPFNFNCPESRTGFVLLSSRTYTESFGNWHRIPVQKFISFLLLSIAWPVGWNWVRKRGAKGQISSSHGRLQEETFRPVGWSQSEPAAQSTLYDKGHRRVSHTAIGAAVRVCYELYQKPKRSGTWI